MCFETTKSARAKIAKTDIECWKVIKKDFYPLYWSDNFRTKKQARKYIRNKLCNRVLFSYCNGKNYRVIELGYHSCKEKDGIKISSIMFYHENDGIICKFIIPAGTRYYENETEYVSETIIMK